MARGVEGAEIAEVTSRAAKGIVGRDGHGTLWAGNPYLAGEMGADLRHPTLAALDSGAQTVVYLGRGRQVLGAATVADEARSS
ncbi:cation-transporting P-type ATPase, partial [Paracoccus sp. Z118]|nr:cation-transporting P-type ATPase [Paracoccus sp. Z118]